MLLPKIISLAAAWLISSAITYAASLQIAFHNGSASLVGMTNRPAGLVVDTSTQFWNQISANQHSLSLNAVLLRDATGAESSALLSYRAGYAGINGNGWISNNQDWVMMDCWFGLAGTEFLKVENLPETFITNGYTLRIFGDSNEDYRDMTYSVGNSIQRIFDRGMFAGNFVANSNYVEFTNLTAKSFVLHGNATGKRSAINGLQILTDTNSVASQPRVLGFSAKPAYLVHPDAEATLYWELANADQIEIEPGVGDVTALTTNGQGSLKVAVTNTTVFTLTAANASSSIRRTTRVFVGPRRPNFIVFLVDDMGWQDTSVPFWTNRTAFNARYHTPGMDTLAANGMKFTAAYAYTVCSPTRVSLLTGQSAARHGVTQWLLNYNADGSTTSPSLNSPSDWNVNGLAPALDNDSPRVWRTDALLPFELRDRGGYRTIHVGKAHFGVSGLLGQHPQHLGFDINIGGNHRGAPGSYYGTNLFGSGGNRVPDMDPYYGEDIFLTEALTRKAATALTEAVQEQIPFFLYMAHYAVHQPIVIDPRFSGSYPDLVANATEHRYATMLEGMDKSLRDLLALCTRLGIAEDTLVLFLSDNGGLSANGRGVSPYGAANTHNWPLRAGKGSAYEGGIRVPMLISWAKPSASNSFQLRVPIRAGAVYAEPVSVTDVFPTLMSLAGLPMSSEVDGVDISGGLKGGSEIRRSAPLLFHYPHTWAQSGYVPAHGYAPHSALRDGKWKIIYFYEERKWELYDLLADISETTNLAASQPKILVTLARKLVRRLHDMGGTLPVLKQTNSQAHPLMPYADGLDSDSDGIPDSEEDSNRNGLLDPAETDPERPDTDEDGASDAQEKLAGTDPRDPGSTFRSAIRLLGDGLLVSWPTLSSASYSIEATTNLASAWWTPVLKDTPGEIGETSFCFPFQNHDAREMYFRVVRNN